MKLAICSHRRVGNASHLATITRFEGRWVETMLARRIIGICVLVYYLLVLFIEIL